MNAGQFAKQRARIERRAGSRAAFVRKAMEHLVRESGALQIIVKGQVAGWVMPDGGVVCVKRRYMDAMGAQMELARIARYARQVYVPVRAYPCPYCRGFHLTSQWKKSAANDNYHSV